MSGQDGGASRGPVELTVLRPESCAGCGLCCEGVGSPVLLYQSRPALRGPHPFRPPGLPRELIEEIDRHFLGLFRGQEPQECCLWFDPATRRCRHYEWRPRVCRDYELGGRACRALRLGHISNEKGTPVPRLCDPPGGTDLQVCADLDAGETPVPPNLARFDQ